jgi:hypothetical protein
VALVVLDDAPILDVAIPCEIFGRARAQLPRPWYDFRVCAVEPGRTRAGAGFAADTGYGLAELARAGSRRSAASAPRPTCGTTSPGWRAWRRRTAGERSKAGDRDRSSAGLPGITAKGSARIVGAAAMRWSRGLAGTA